MSVLQMLAVVLAGFGAGLINTVVGSGSLITYPVMVMLGVPPVQANIANTVGLVPGSIAGSWGYRHELGETRSLLVRLGAASVVGAVIGAFLLTRLPSVTFQMVVPVLILFAALLVAFQPRIARAMKPVDGTRWGPLLIVVFLAGIYGGYFSAAQGVILLGVLGLFLSAGIQTQNAVKNVLQTLVNVVAALFFVLTGDVRWEYAALVAVGSIIGALVGAFVGRRIPAQAFRVFIVVFGVAMAIYMGWRAFA
ncbi:sulfite exporter TauE/SafE family protein [Nigerium sp.]|uniref:sulfite exporter TauE/SafE family protein n=1 Tax=Nigerium sp. TaxID=2042655 RepID=UPI003221DA5F